MRLLALSVLFYLILDINGAAPPGRGRPQRRGGSSHLSAIRNAARGHYSKSKHYVGSGPGSGTMSGAGSKNRTVHVVYERDASSVELYSYYSTSTAVAPYRPQDTSTKSRNRQKRSPPLPHSHHPPHRNTSSTPLPHGHQRPGLKTSSSSNTPDNSGSASRTIPGSSKSNVKVTTKTKPLKRSPLNLAPTPAPTATGNPDTTVHISDENDFSLLLPKIPGELISDAEADGVSFCTKGDCTYMLPNGFITAAAVKRAPDNKSWIQVTGCIDTSKSILAASDDGGQFDVRFPNGAQCTFGGYGASFIEQVEPAAGRFCIRCCAKENDQKNCNSHQDRSGCVLAIPGTYEFPEKGISCA